MHLGCKDGLMCQHSSSQLHGVGNLTFIFCHCANRRLTELQKFTKSA